VARIARVVVWIFALFLLWELFVGTIQSTELVAGAIAAVVGVGLVEAFRAAGLLGLRVSATAVAQTWRVPGQLVFDFGLVIWVLLRDLAHGRRVRGAWVEVEYPVEPGAPGAFHRALVTAIGCETANAIVVDLDHDRALLHAVEPGVSTGRSPL
jgi:hypothetical protein